MSYKIYPVTKTEPICEDYRVRIGGEEVALNTARASAMPFNRRWPGHQRQIEQSEAVSFLSLCTDETLSFEIIPREPFEEVKIRPQSLGITPTVRDGRIYFTLERPAYFTVEAYGRNRALHIFADPIPTYDVDKNDKNVIYFGKGEHDAGLIELHSGQTLFIDEGAVVYASVHAIDARDIRILGRGILDNSKNHAEILFEANEENNKTAVNNARRRHTVELEYCTDVEIEGITIRDSLVYNVRPIGCENLSIKNLKIIGCWRYNSDGIDMHNCKNVRIEKCFLRTFDDSICIKGFDCYYDGDIEKAVHAAMYRGGKAYDVFENVQIEDCVIFNDWGKSLEIGAETRAEHIRNITFKNCDIIHLTGTALDVMNVDYADVYDVTFKNIVIEADEIIPQPMIQTQDEQRYENLNESYMPYTIRAEVVYHHEYSAGGARRGKNRDITFENISVLGDKLPKAIFIGYDSEHKTENVLVKNLTLNGAPITSLPKENFEIRPFAENITMV